MGIPQSAVAGESFPLRAVKCVDRHRLHLSTKGMEFRGNVLSTDGKKSVAASIEWNEKAHHHEVTLPWWMPSDFYTINIILLQVGGQAPQDPPCFQSLTVRTHCENETLWFSHIASTYLTFKLEQSLRPLPTRQHCEPWDNSAGLWRQKEDGRWSWDNPFCFKVNLDPVLPPLPLSSKKCAFLGDSTLASINKNLRSRLKFNETCMFYTTYLTINANMTLEGMRARKRKFNEHPTVIIYNAGLHATCYSNMRDELTRMRPILQNMLNVADHVVVRSTVGLTYLPGMDFVKRKCLYYTERRIIAFNAEVKRMCSELNIPFWDIYAMTASSFPFSSMQVTDGTHYCTMKTTNKTIGYACREEMMMLFSILAKFMSPDMIT